MSRGFAVHLNWNRIDIYCSVVSHGRRCTPQNARYEPYSFLLHHLAQAAMRVLLKHASVARRALRSAELSGKFGEAACTQGPKPAPYPISLRCLHASAAASASKDDDKQDGNFR